MYPADRPEIDIPNAPPPTELSYERLLAQRDEARLRVNLMAVSAGGCEVYPIPRVHEALWQQLREALAPK
jgi:hypothetical protein